MNIIFKTLSGSKLYGIDTEKSDTDYKGIYLPTLKEIMLNDFKKSVVQNTNNNTKNTKDDSDVEYYSIHYYTKMLYEGDTGAIDMLHSLSNQNAVIINHPIMQELYKNRKSFYTKSMRAFVGYSKKMASLYGHRSTRLNEIENLIEFLQPYKSENLSNVWNILPLSKNLIRTNDMYEICTRKCQKFVTVQYLLDMLSVMKNSYGNRVKSLNNGVDYKALSHAIRVCYEMKEIYTTNDLIFPLKERELIRDIKLGKKDYQNFISPLLEQLLEEVEQIANKSNYPEKVDKEYWNEWLFQQLKKHYK
jgi:hypothetical protein